MTGIQPFNLESLTEAVEALQPDQRQSLIRFWLRLDLEGPDSPSGYREAFARQRIDELRGTVPVALGPVHKLTPEEHTELRHVLAEMPIRYRYDEHKAGRRADWRNETVRYFEAAETLFTDRALKAAIGGAP
jgi:hypothetical protein